MSAKRPHSPSTSQSADSCEAQTLEAALKRDISNSDTPLVYSHADIMGRDPVKHQSPSSESDAGSYTSSADSESSATSESDHAVKPGVAEQRIQL
jgi:hypothetical protein